MCLAQGPQRSDGGDARTRGPSVSSQALYHCAHCRAVDNEWGSCTLIALICLHTGKHEFYYYDGTI